MCGVDGGDHESDMVRLCGHSYRTNNLFVIRYTQERSHDDTEFDITTISSCRVLYMSDLSRTTHHAHVRKTVLFDSESLPSIVPQAVQHILLYIPRGVAAAKPPARPVASQTRAEAHL